MTEAGAAGGTSRNTDGKSPSSGKKVRTVGAGSLTRRHRVGREQTPGTLPDAPSPREALASTVQTHFNLILLVKHLSACSPINAFLKNYMA